MTKSVALLQQAVGEQPHVHMLVLRSYNKRMINNRIVHVTHRIQRSESHFPSCIRHRRSERRRHSAPADCSQYLRDLNPYGNVSMFRHDQQVRYRCRPKRHERIM